MWLLLQSIIVYSFLAGALYVAASSVTYEQSLEIQNPRHWYSLPKGYWWCTIIFAVVSGMRWNVGVDHLQYLSFYETLASGRDIYRETIEPGFMLLFRVFAKSGLHYFFFFAFVAFLQLFFLISSVKKQCDVVKYLVVLIVLGSYYLQLCNGLRQCLVACSFIWLCQYINERNWKILIIWILVALSFHRSAILLVPFFALSFIKSEWSNAKIMVPIMFGCILIGENPIWTSKMESLDQFVGFMGYDEYSDQFVEMVSGDRFRTQNWGPSKISILSLNIFVVLYYEKVRAYFYRDKCLGLYYKYCFIGACFYYLFTNTSHIFLRPVEYFTLFLLPMTAYTLSYLKSSDSKFSYRIMSTMAFTYIFISCYKAYIDVDGMGNSSTLFQFFFSTELLGH